MLRLCALAVKHAGFCGQMSLAQQCYCFNFKTPNIS